MIKVQRLWRDGKFRLLSQEAKLVYLYLATAPSINTLGLICALVSDVCHDLSITEAKLRDACLELLEGFISVYKEEGLIYFFVKGHYESLPKSDAVVRKAEKDLSLSPKGLIEQMESEGDLPNLERENTFTPPSIAEVEEYAISLGYIINGKEFIEFHENNAERLGRKGWYDGRDKQVRDWKGKIRKVWSKRAEKLQPVEGAPKGMEFFFAKDGDRIVQVKRWKNGLPYGDGIIQDKVLQDKFKDICK